MSAADMLGVTLSQNALESFHRVIKQVCVNAKRLPTAAVLNYSFPGIPSVAGMESVIDTVTHFCEGVN